MGLLIPTTPHCVTAVVMISTACNVGYNKTYTHKARGRVPLTVLYCQLRNMH